MRQGGSTEGFWMVSEGQETGQQGGCGAGPRRCAVSGNEEIQKISHKDKQSYTTAESPKREHKLCCHIYHVTSGNNITSA